MRKIDFLDIKLKQIQMFLAVVDMGSIKEAAEYLHLSQSMLSKNIQAFENELDLVLFVRSKKRLQLTPAAKILAQEFRTAISLVQSSIIKAQIQQSEQTKPIVIGIPESINPEKCVLPSIHNFLSVSDSFKYYIELFNMQQLSQKLLSKEIDIAFSALFENETFSQIEDLKCEIIARFPLSVNMSPDNPMAQKRDLLMEDLKGMDLILISTFLMPNYESNILTSLCDKYGFKPKVAYYTISNSIDALVLNMKKINEVFISDCCMKEIPTLKRIPLKDTESGVVIAWRKDSNDNIMQFVNETIDYWKTHIVE